MEILPQNAEFWNNQKNFHLWAYAWQCNISLCPATRNFMCTLETEYLSYLVLILVPWQFTVISIKTEYNETTGFVFDQYLTMADPQQQIHMKYRAIFPLKIKEERSQLMRITCLSHNPATTVQASLPRLTRAFSDGIHKVWM